MQKLINLAAFQDFLRSNSLGSIMLFICVILSLVIANTPGREPFLHILEFPLGFNTGNVDLEYTVEEWINDGLMAVFFLLVGLEIKRELVEGELSSPKKAVLPILCAIGGAVMPALIYSVINKGLSSAEGWGIPMATDIAFSLALINVLGKKVPVSLKVFLAALAIVDDLIAILVIAVFYSSDIHFQNLFYAGIILLLMLLLNWVGVKKLIFYLVPGVFVWYFVHHSGIHATIAGVLVAMTIPTTPDDKVSPLERLEHALGTPVNFLIIPLFALANTAIHFEREMVEEITAPLSLGIILGLVLGKPLGILMTSWLSVKLGISQRPEKASWMHMLGVGALAGIGFTMSIFISLLSFHDELQISEAKFAILLASIFSGFLGYFILLFVHKKSSNS